MSEGTPPPPPPENPPGGSTPPPGGSTPPPPGGSAPPPAQGGQGGSGAPPPPPPQGAPSGYGAPGAPPPVGPRPGELLDRFLARLIDLVLVGVVGAIINAVLVAAIITSGSGGFGYGGSFSVYSLVSSIVLTVLYVGYFAFMESSQGKTLGKMVMNLHVEGLTGGKPTLEQAAKRNIWLAFPILGVLPVLWFVGAIAALVAEILIAVQINSDPERRPWTDRFADTRVIKEG